MAMDLLTLLAGSRFSYDAGVSGTVTVPAGKQVIGGMVMAPGGGSFTIAPGGANHPNPVVAGPSIPLPAGSSFDLAIFASATQLGGGTTFVFSGTASYMVMYAQHKAG